MNEGALAHVTDDEIIARISKGEFSSHIARELGVAKQSLHERISKHPHYRTAIRLRNEENLDAAQTLIDWSPDLARAREQFRAAAWRAERECPEIWGPKQEIKHSGSITLDVILSAEES